MNRIRKIFAFGAIALTIAGTAIAAPQLKQLIKVLGVNALINQYGKDIDKELNKMIKRSPNSTTATKVVPILTGGIGSRKSVGMVQVSGPKARVETVKAVAQIEQEFLGELRIQAMIPIASDKIVENMHPVEQVGVTGIIDLKL